MATIGRIRPKAITRPYDVPILDVVQEEIQSAAPTDPGSPIDLTEEVVNYRTDPAFYFDTLTAIEELLLEKGLIP